MRDHNGILSFRPRLPESLSRLAFRMRFRGRKLLVEVEHGRVTYSLAEGSALEIVHYGRRATVPAQRPLERAIPSLKAREDPSQPRGRAPRRQGSPR